MQMSRKRSDSLPVVALVPDYDLSFERTLVEFLRPGEAVHVVVPAWHTARAQSRDRPHHVPRLVVWNDRGPNRSGDHLRHLTHLSNWRWYRDEVVDQGTGSLRGPLLVKVSGSPLLSLSDVASLELRKGEKVQLATVFTRHDSLQAILSFADVDQKARVPPRREHDRRTRLCQNS